MTENAEKPQDIAVLIPCYNEEATIAQVVGDFRAALPEARICVFDNNSSDRTSEAAREAGLRLVGASASIGPIGTTSASSGLDSHRPQERFQQVAL